MNRIFSSTVLASLVFLVLSQPLSAQSRIVARSVDGEQSELTLGDECTPYDGDLGGRLHAFFHQGCVGGFESLAFASRSCFFALTCESAVEKLNYAVNSIVPDDMAGRIVQVQLTGGVPAIDATRLQPDMAASLFGEGYHAFWQNDLVKAQEKLELAVAADGQDARSWYYLAMTRMVQGDMDGSVPLYARAVQLHRDGKPRSDVVGMALERVQGPLRMALEEVRGRTERTHR